MRSLKKLNAAAGTSYTRWKQVTKALVDSQPVLTPGEDQRENGPHKEEPVFELTDAQRKGIKQNIEEQKP